MLLPITASMKMHTLASALVVRTASVVHSIMPSMVATAAPSTWLSALNDAPLTYLLLGGSAIVTEELSPIFGGIAVYEGELRLQPVLYAITFGGWIATTLLYFLGRWKWETIRRRFPRVRSTGTVALRVVRKNQLTASLLVRFAFGLRIALPIVCGAARVPLFIYLPMSLLGSALWTALFTAIGYAAGEAAVRVIGHLDGIGKYIGALVVGGAVLLFVRWQRRRTERKLARRRGTAPTD